MTPEQLVQLAADLKLTRKQKALADAYAEGPTAGNGTTSAQVAGYKGSALILASHACETLKLPKVREYLQKLTEAAVEVVEERTGEKIMSLADALEGMTNIARFRVGDLLKDDGELDVQKVKAVPAGVLRKVKIRSTTDSEGQVYAQHEVEAESAAVALQALIRHHSGLDVPQGPNVNVFANLTPEVVAAIGKAWLAGGQRRLPQTVEAEDVTVDKAGDKE